MFANRLINPSFTLQRHHYLWLFPIVLDLVYTMIRAFSTLVPLALRIKYIGSISLWSFSLKRDLVLPMSFFFSWPLTGLLQHMTFIWRDNFQILTNLKLTGCSGRLPDSPWYGSSGLASIAGNGSFTQTRYLFPLIFLSISYLSPYF